MDSSTKLRPLRAAPLRSPTIPARYVAAIVRYAESLGLARRSILAEASIEHGRLDDPDAALTTAELDQVLRNIVERTGRPDLGFQVGRRLTWEMHGALGRALQRCASLDQALELHSHCYSLIMPAFLVDYRRHHGAGTVSFRPAVGMSHETLCMLNEMHAASFHVLVTEAVGVRLPPYDIHLPTHAPAHAARYRELAPARVHFERMPLPVLRIVCGPGMLSLPMTLADPRYVAQQRTRLERRLAPAGSDDSWSEWVALLLREAEDCQPTLPQVAEIVGIGSQALARRLAREGRSFRQLSNTIRHERASRLLRDGATPVAQIASRLGYTSVANFSTAFRREAGVSPRRFRNNVGALSTRHATRRDAQLRG